MYVNIIKKRAYVYIYIYIYMCESCLDKYISIVTCPLTKIPDSAFTNIRELQAHPLPFVSLFFCMLQRNGRRIVLSIAQK